MQKNLVITLEDKTQGTFFNLKTTSESNGILLHGDPATYPLEEIEKAIAELKKFINERDNPPIIYISKTELESV